jgi:hypothetical protein
LASGILVTACANPKPAIPAQVRARAHADVEKKRAAGKPPIALVANPDDFSYLFEYDPDDLLLKAHQEGKDVTRLYHGAYPFERCTKLERGWYYCQVT